MLWVCVDETQSKKWEMDNIIVIVIIINIITYEKAGFC